jgi:hypothetical protein
MAHFIRGSFALLRCKSNDDATYLLGIGGSDNSHIEPLNMLEDLEMIFQFRGEFLFSSSTCLPKVHCSKQF